MTNFATQLSAAVAEDGDRPAIKLDDIVLDYRALDAGVARAAGLLRIQCECNSSVFGRPAESDQPRHTGAQANRQQ